MLEKLHELTQKGFTVSFEPYFVAGPHMRIKLYRDRQYAVYIISNYIRDSLKDGNPITREELIVQSLDEIEKEFIVKTLDELEQDFYREFGKERHVLYP